MTRVLILSALVLSSGNATAQNWDSDARHIAMGNVSTTNVSMSMIDEQRRYTSIPLPFGLFQVLDDLDIYNPNSPKFDPIRAVEYVASPIHATKASSPRAMSSLKVSRRRTVAAGSRHVRSAADYRPLDRRQRAERDDADRERRYGTGGARRSRRLPLADIRVELPVDYRGNVSYDTGTWSATAEVGHGFGGGSFHGGYEHRFGRLEARGGARYTFSMWNPSAGFGVDLSRKVSVDVAGFGTATNIERKRQLAIAASIRINHFPRP